MFCICVLICTCSCSGAFDDVDYSIADVSHYNDGGSIKVTMRSDGNKIIVVAFDDRIKTDTRFRAYLSKSEYIFDTLIPHNSNMEHFIIRKLCDAITREISLEEQVKLRDYNYQPKIMNNRIRDLRSIIRIIANLESI
jgi:hypothetical protein